MKIYLTKDVNKYYKNEFIDEFDYSVIVENKNDECIFIEIIQWNNVYNYIKLILIFSIFFGFSL